MFNCIESDALMGVCRALNLTLEIVDMDNGGVYIVGDGGLEQIGDASWAVFGVKLSDYLLATAPVKEA